MVGGRSGRCNDREVPPIHQPQSWQMYVRRFMPNTHRRRRRDATVELSRVGVSGVYWALLLPRPE